MTHAFFFLLRIRDATRIGYEARKWLPQKGSISPRLFRERRGRGRGRGGKRSYPNPGRTIRDAGWWTRKGSKRCRGDVRSNGTGSRYSSRWVGCRSIWLNRNGRGDIFKPGKVWCLAVRVGWYRGVGRASHKFTLSYHQMATIPVQALADPAKRSRDFLVPEKRPFLLHTYTHARTRTRAHTCSFVRLVWSSTSNRR